MAIKKKKTAKRKTVGTAQRISFTVPSKGKIYFHPHRPPRCTQANPNSTCPKLPLLYCKVVKIFGRQVALCFHLQTRRRR